MLKKALIRGLKGILTGIGIGYLLALFFSSINSLDNVQLVTPLLVDKMGSELNALIVQTILTGAIGFYSSALSVIWEMEWSIAKQSGIFSLGLLAFLLPVAYFLKWIDGSILGVLSFVIVFFIVFVIIWLVMRMYWKSKIYLINKKIAKEKVVD